MIPADKPMGLLGGLKLHEFPTPADPPPPPEVAETLERIATGVEHMARALEALLAIARRAENNRTES